ncbi:tol-pal system protein YbgF [Niveibacterium sp. 24ML]|uniref:tol-pal system protein YbgF n=1 Tax=Niveibacterium sp. 24ML TaxID=2985512 RepID=UPI0022714B57|nr:tol-pal system protein YbgF [Niveibacterium sp. 24ML]MCX9154759.1 tol-pal system protein YbgF [Niveibacterium sp. 24ML]
MRAIVLALMLGAVALPARAGLFDDDVARKQIEALRVDHENRLQKLEASARGQIELANQIESLKQEIAKLRGQIEVLTNDLDQSQKRQRDFYVDLDTRLRKFETVAVAAEGGDAAPAADPANETRDYEAALNLVKAGKNKEAAAAFIAFTKAHPKSSFLPSANYWAASALYQQREIAEAVKYYGKTADTWPDDARAPDALLGLSNCQAELGDKKGARASLEKIVSRYPSSPAAQTAKQRLGKK